VGAGTFAASRSGHRARIKQRDKRRWVVWRYTVKDIGTIRVRERNARCTTIKCRRGIPAKLTDSKRRSKRRTCATLFAVTVGIPALDVLRCGDRRHTGSRRSQVRVPVN
jgi:hypothetical protein